MNQEPSSEDRTILAALEALERGKPYPALPPGQRDEVAETLARLYTEVLGLIPSELEPVAPRPEVKARLMALIAGEETQDVRPEAAAPPLAPVPVPVASEPLAPAEPAERVSEQVLGGGSSPLSQPPPAQGGGTQAPGLSFQTPSETPATAAPTPPQPAEPPGGGALSREAGEGWGGGTPAPPAGSAVSSATDLPRPVPVPARPAGPVMRPASRWPQALAAALALVALGFSFWLGATNFRQRQTIADLQRQLGEQGGEGGQQGQGDLQQRLREAETRLQELRTLSQVVQYEVEASPLQPVGEAPMFPQARGVLLVAPDHQHWYMSVRNLGPAGDGRVYQLWFDSGSGMVSGGTFTARPGEPAELSSQEMPTGIRGVVVTLEPGEGSAAPTGPEVLRATNVYPIV